MLETFIRRWSAQVLYKIEAVLETLTSDCRYVVHGTAAFGSAKVDSIEAARAMYLSMFRAGLMPGGPIDDLQVAFGDWGLSFSGVFTLALPGAALQLPTHDLQSDQLYLVQSNASASISYRGDLIEGETLYMGSPFNIEPTNRDEIARILGWDPRSYKANER